MGDITKQDLRKILEGASPTTLHDILFQLTPWNESINLILDCPPPTLKRALWDACTWDFTIVEEERR